MKINDKTATLISRLFWNTYVETQISLATLLLFVVGILIIPVRIFSLTGFTQIYYAIILALFITAICSFIKAKLNQPSESDIVTYLDKFNRAGGILIGSYETKTNFWQQSIPEISIPEINYNINKPLLFLLSSIGFLLLALSIPIDDIPVNNKQTQKLAVDDIINSLKEKIDLLKKENIIDEKQEEFYVKELKNIENNADAFNPQKSWDSIDRLENSLNMTAENSAEKSISSISEISKLEQSARSLDKNKNNFSKQDVDQMVKEMSELMKNAAANREALNKMLPQDLLNKINDKNMKAEDIKKVIMAMQNGVRNQMQQMQKLAAQNMIDKKRLKDARAAQKIGKKQLEEFLKKNCKNGNKLGQCVAQGGNALVGNGGIGKGPGDANISWGQLSEYGGVDFNEIKLPETSKEGQQITTGLSSSAPEKKEVSTTKSGAAAQISITGGSAQKNIILPKHQKIIKDYFNKE